MVTGKFSALLVKGVMRPLQRCGEPRVECLKWLAVHILRVDVYCSLRDDAAKLLLTRWNAFTEECD